MDERTRNLVAELITTYFEYQHFPSEKGYRRLQELIHGVGRTNYHYFRATGGLSSLTNYGERRYIIRSLRQLTDMAVKMMVAGRESGWHRPGDIS